MRMIFFVACIVCLDAVKLAAQLDHQGCTFCEHTRAAMLREIVTLSSVTLICSVFIAAFGKEPMQSRENTNCNLGHSCFVVQFLAAHDGGIGQ